MFSVRQQYIKSHTEVLWWKVYKHVSRLVSLSVFWQPVCCPDESRSPLSSLCLGAAASSQSTRSGVQYQETVYSQDVKSFFLFCSKGPVISISNLQRFSWWEVTDVYVEERRRKYGSLGKTVLQDMLSADLVAEKYPKVSLANMAGD